MKPSQLVLQSLRYYWRGHLGLLFGAFLAALVLTGSLLVGDSVRASLRRIASLRLAKVEAGVLGGDRWFSERLARQAGAVPMVMANGAVSLAAGEVRVNAVQVLGVEEGFWKLGPSGRDLPLERGEVAVNAALAKRLGVGVGETILVRLERPSSISRDAPLSGSTNEEVSLRRKIAAVVSADDFGAFQLVASQRQADTVFIGLEDLLPQIEMEGRVNVLLTSEAVGLAGRVEAEAGLEDFSLKVKRLEGGDQPEWQVSTDRVFVDPVVADELLQRQGGFGVLTYLVNGIRTETGGTPYSMVTALPDEVLKARFGAGETGDSKAWISQWLAEDQGLKIGDSLTLQYFVVGLGRELKEETATFEVAGIVPMNVPVMNADWTPDFPGVSDVDNCRDWNPGIPMDTAAIRDQDEEYWDKYRGTPKVFLTLSAGQRLWSNRFGDLTSVRVPDMGQSEQAVAAELLSGLKLSDIGLVPRDFGGEAAAAAEGSVDFGGLFVGLSFFLVAGALVFATLLFLFTLERRVGQVGLLLAVGWTASQVKRSLLWEASGIAVVGVLLGVIGGQVYTRAALAGLRGAWSGASQGLDLIYSPEPVTFWIAGISTLVVVLLTLAWASWGLFKTPVRVLLAGGQGMGEVAYGKGRRWLSILAVVLCAAGSVGLLWAGGTASSPEAVAGMFFGAGTLLLTAGLILFRRWMGAQLNAGKGKMSGLQSLSRLGLLSVVRRPSRSLAVVGMMAGGVFLVTAVNAFRMSADESPDRRDTGTGGFSLIGESSLPVYENLAEQEGIEAFGLDEALMVKASMVPFRVREGDDASCLNLNRAQRPVLVGVDAALLSQRKAFRFAAGGDGGWAALASQSEAGVVPAIADQATALWGLGKGVGDSIDYEDSSGATFRVKLVGLVAGSVLQGKMIVDEKAFLNRYPDTSGYRFFLIDAPASQRDKLSAHLTRQLEKRGLALEPVKQRLEAFQSVQNTYIGIFTVLGGLGVLLGSAGLGVLVARHVLERRGELALMLALGFRAARLRRMLLVEHGLLLATGLVLGLLSAVMAVWPNLRNSAQDLPMPTLAALWLGVLLFGLIACGLATRLALRGRLLEALRRE